MDGLVPSVEVPILPVLAKQSDEVDGTHELGRNAVPQEWRSPQHRRDSSTTTVDICRSSQLLLLMMMMPRSLPMVTCRSRRSLSLSLSLGSFVSTYCGRSCSSLAGLDTEPSRLCTFSFLHEHVCECVYVGALVWERMWGDAYVTVSNDRCRLVPAID